MNGIVLLPNTFVSTTCPNAVGLAVRDICVKVRPEEIQNTGGRFGVTPLSGIHFGGQTSSFVQLIRSEKTHYKKFSAETVIEKVNNEAYST